MIQRRPLLLFVAIATFAHPSFANNFRVAPQVILPATGSAVTPWAIYQSKVTLRNETTDSIAISVTFRPYGAQSIAIERPNAIRLAPGQQCVFDDFVGAATSKDPQCKVLTPFNASAFGHAVFSGCLDGADCGGFTGQQGPAFDNYRNISVESRIYLFVPGADIGTSVGQDMPGLHWLFFGDARNPIRITGIEASDQFRSNLVLVNGSPYCAETVTAWLYDGASGALRDRADVHLNPGEGEQFGILNLFPKFGAWAQQNPTRAATNVAVVLTVSGAVPTADAATFGCPDGCPALFAVGSMIARGNDATTLEATFTRDFTAAQVASLFGPGSIAGATPKALAPGALSERAQAVVSANMTQNVMQGMAVQAAAAKAQQSATVKAAVAAPHRRLEKE